jgi:hypothetical protein
MRTTLIVLSVAAVVLGVFTYFIVFFPSGSYQPVIIKGPGTTPLPSSTIATSTLSTTSTVATSTATGTLPTATSIGSFASGYSAPYPLAWTVGASSLSLTAASFENNNLTLVLTVQPTDGSRCVPINIQLIADESGTLKAPDAVHCDNASGATYTESLTFAVDPTYSPFLFTTGDSANVFFTVATTSAGGVDVSIPQHSG